MIKLFFFFYKYLIIMPLNNDNILIYLGIKKKNSLFEVQPNGKFKLIKIHNKI